MKQYLSAFTKVRILVAALAIALILPLISLPEITKADYTNTRADNWGTLEYGPDKSLNWLNGSGVDVYSNGPTILGPSPDTYNCYAMSGHTAQLGCPANTEPTGIEWQCVELVNRLAMTKGWITSRWAGYGNTLVNSVPAGWTRQDNDHISYIDPGDVITLDDGNLGHAGVINTIGSSIQTVNQNIIAVLDNTSITSGSLDAGNAHLSSYLTGYTVQSVIHHPGPSLAWGGLGSATYTGGDSMASGTTMLRNYYLTAANVQHALVFQTDSNLVLYSGNGTVLWSSGTGGSNGDHLVMQTDGNLVMYRADNTPVWWTGTGGHSGSWANLQSDGNFVVRDSGAAYWQTGTGGHPNLTYFGSDRLLGSSGQQLTQNQYLRSSDGSHALLMQSNGNAVLYGPGYHILWQTYTNGHGDRLTMQTDGNLVLYALSTAWWQSITSGSSNYAVAQTDGNLVLYNSSNFPLWLTGTGGKT